jgi:RIO kinase 1
MEVFSVKILLAVRFYLFFRVRTKDKRDRATAEQVMDPRTRMILFKLLSRGTISTVNGCISTGKEANVYHATGKENQDVAIKIYKTSILLFKDRDKYVSGEFRLVTHSRGSLN